MEELVYSLSNLTELRENANKKCHEFDENNKRLLKTIAKSILKAISEFFKIEETTPITNKGLGKWLNLIIWLASSSLISFSSNNSFVYLAPLGKPLIRLRSKTRNELVLRWKILKNTC